MKKTRFIASVLVCFIILLSGCTDEIVSSAKGSITISINDEHSKGITPGISLEPAYYLVNGDGPGESELSFRISLPAKMHTENDVLVGKWTLTAMAYNDSGVAIGSGTSDAVVKTGIQTNVSITVKEFSGQGTLNVVINGIESEDAFTLCIYEPKNLEEPLYEVSFKDSEDAFTASQILPVGYYLFVVECNNEYIKLPALDSIRVVDGDTLTATYTLSNKGDISTSITNAIAPTPSLAVSLDSEVIYGDGSITATAIASNCKTENLSYSWYLDNYKIQGSSSSITLSNAGMDKGKHDITCVIADSSANIAWSDSASFESIGKDLISGAKIGTLELPFLVVAAGQGSGANDLCSLLEDSGKFPGINSKVDYYNCYSSVPAAIHTVMYASEEDSNPVNTCILVLSAVDDENDLRELSEPTMEEEIESKIRFINTFKNMNMKVVAVYFEDDRRAANEEIINGICPYVDHIIVTKASNTDDAFDNFVNASSSTNVPVTEVDSEESLVELLAMESRRYL